MKQNNSVIPIFFSSDDNYLPFLAVSVHSLIQNASPDYTYCIHILNNGLDEARVAHILNMQTENISIHLADVSGMIEPIAAKLNLRDYYTASIYYRLFIASMFPQYHKAIYLDADIAVNGDISELYRMPLGQNIVGAVSDDIIAGHKDFRRYAEEGIGILYQRYFNSGVLLMNLDQFRLQHIERKFVYLLQTYHFDTVCPDQDYLNVLCRDRVLYLDKGWNKMSIDKKYDGVPNLIHYNMFYKPWMYRNIPYGEYFWKYAAMTPFYEELRTMQNNFGWRGKREHGKANRELHRHALRICRSSDNFRQVLQLNPLHPSQLSFGVENEA